MRKYIDIAKEKLKFGTMLSLLSIERYKMYRVSKKYRKENPNGTIRLLDDFLNFDLSVLNNEKIILFVIYAPKSILMYERYFELLEKLNYKIITISNGKLDKYFIDSFKDRTLFMAERHNIGRDFGTYKEFIQLLKTNNIQPKEIIICNDSIFANLIKSDNRFIEFMQKNEQEDFIGVAEYLWQPGYHVQSYFLKFSNDVFNGKYFSKFWEDFFISDDRRANIHNGEIKLSESILKDGFKPTIFLDTANLIDTIVDDEVLLQKFLIEVSGNRHLDQHLVGSLKNLHLAFYDKKTTKQQTTYYKASLKQEISRLIQRYGIIVVAPFFIIDEFGFPFLKRDLVYRQITDWMLITNYAKNFDQELLSEYLKDQRIRKRPWNFSSLKEKLMYSTGMN
ncbi:rhamnan synthesis F family protein [Conservatibacter flavescens]|uniref:Rhamnan synthesis protein F n=1 Tax=Conservatibacter flavescens TaxID=28161 RepID=A0A2M8RZS7_9PAST|nr:rhamnan synthesis F family protein [Conservatibacter flavescens]PJG84402.1 hypothetical protein CVP05_11650 [Conservatibacter flavescens]